MPFKLYQCFERVPLHGKEADRVIVTGSFECPDGHNADVLVEVRITAPPIAVSSWSGNTGAGFPSFDIAGAVIADFPPWAKHMCGQEVTIQARGFCTLSFTEWETFEKVVVGPRSDDFRRTWSRKVDGDMHVPPDAYQPAKRWYPGTLDELLWCVQNRHDKDGPVAEARATASHWALSYASVTPGQMFETATPVHEGDGNQMAARLNNVLYDAFPECLTQEARGFFERTQRVHAFNPKVPVDEHQNYLFHVEAGIRLHELYAYIDGDADGREKRSLAAQIEEKFKTSTNPPPNDEPCYLGPWALETMGGAGGQTIVGVASTATHGGDVEASAIGELVVAMHLIAPDGQEYWIERTGIRPSTLPLKLFDEAKLRKVYRVRDPGAPGGTYRTKDIIYKRDDDLMNAALVSCGRMGVIYSVVVRAVRQYGLNQVTSKGEWKDVKKWISNPADPANIALFKNRFVRIDVEMYPQPDFDWGDAAWAFGAFALTNVVGLAAAFLIGLKGDEYRTWHLTRAMVPLDDTTRADSAGLPYFYGRPERGGDNAGKAVNLDVDPGSGCFTAPCRSANFIDQFLADSIHALHEVQWTAIEAYAIATVAMALPLASPLAAIAQRTAANVIIFTEYWMIVMEGIRAALPDTAHFGDFVSAALNALAAIHAQSILQLLYGLAQTTQHLDPDKPLTAISYGVMDEHDYKNIGCVAPGESIELFFDATKPDFVSFVDYLLDGVRDLADDGDSWGGYVSMRFMTESPSFLAMQRWPRTVSMEIATLSRASGANELMSKIDHEARSRGIMLHWGQRNNYRQADIEKLIPMGKWRDALSVLSEHGRLANLSTEFTRLRGLEITVPRLYTLDVSLDEGCEHDTTRVHYDAFNNPPGTRIELTQRFDSGSGTTTTLPDLRGDLDVPFGRGGSTLELNATRFLNGNKYPATPLKRALRGFGTGDFWEFRKTTEPRVIGGVVRWFTEINLFSQRISNSLRVSEVQLSASSGSGWLLHSPEVGDVSFAGLTDIKALAMQPVFNTNWQFRTATAAQGIVPPELLIRFKIFC